MSTYSTINFSPVRTPNPSKYKSWLQSYQTAGNELFDIQIHEHGDGRISAIAGLADPEFITQAVPVDENGNPTHSDFDDDDGIIESLSLDKFGQFVQPMLSEGEVLIIDGRLHNDVIYDQILVDWLGRSIQMAPAYDKASALRRLEAAQ